MINIEETLGPLTQVETESLLIGCITNLTLTDVITCIKAAYTNDPESRYEIAAQLDPNGE